MKGNAPRSGNRYDTIIAARSLLTQIDSGASLQWGDPTKMAATRDYVPARHEVSTYIMSMISTNQSHRNPAVQSDEV